MYVTLLALKCTELQLHRYLEEKLTKDLFQQFISYFMHGVQSIAVESNFENGDFDGFIHFAVI